MISKIKFLHPIEKRNAAIRTTVRYRTHPVVSANTFLRRQLFLNLFRLMYLSMGRSIMQRIKIKNENDSDQGDTCVPRPMPSMGTWISGGGKQSNYFGWKPENGMHESSNGM